MAQLSPLLALPRELRDMIFGFVVEQHWPSPDPVFASISNHTPGIVCHQHEYAKRDLTLNLLSVNRQVRGEALHILKELERDGGFHVDLDITVLGDCFAPILRRVTLGMPLGARFTLHLRLIVQSPEALDLPPNEASHLLLRILNELLFYGPAFHIPPTSNNYRRLGPTPTPFFITRLHWHVTFHDDCNPESRFPVALAVMQLANLLLFIKTVYKYIGRVEFGTDKIMYRGKPSKVEMRRDADAPPWDSQRAKNYMDEVSCAQMGYPFGQEWLAIERRKEVQRGGCAEYNLPPVTSRV